MPGVTEARVGLLLINLGTPDSPATADVRRYLREFLSDPRVIDISPVGRWLLLNLIILPFRPRQSGEAYAKIWDDRGSPLLYHSNDLVEKVRQRLGADVQVELGMRYGNPSIRSALERMRNAGVDRIVVFPLYPQYSSAANGSSLEVVYAETARLWNTPSLQVVPPFYDDRRYLDCCAEVARPVLERAEPDVVYFSFHGLPERQVRKSDDDGYCRFDDACCAAVVHGNRNCYRAQCFATAVALAERLGVPAERRRICFQSRLGRSPWIRPYTDELFDEDPANGARRAVILSPAFVADCLETLEELGMRGAAQWREAGGESLELVPSLNARDSWADAVVAIARDHASWLRPSAMRVEV